MGTAESHLRGIVLIRYAIGVGIAGGLDVRLGADGGRAIGRRAFYAVGAVVEPGEDAGGQQQERPKKGALPHGRRVFGIQKDGPPLTLMLLQRGYDTNTSLQV
jgi:hypothetical protein